MNRARKGVRTLPPRRRDAEGRLLRLDGQIDGRSRIRAGELKGDPYQVAAGRLGAAVRWPPDRVPRLIHLDSLPEAYRAFVLTLIRTTKAEALARAELAAKARKATAAGSSAAAVAPIEGGRDGAPSALD